VNITVRVVVKNVANEKNRGGCECRDHQSLVNLPAAASNRDQAEQKERSRRSVERCVDARHEAQVGLHAVDTTALKTQKLWSRWPGIVCA